MSIQNGIITKPIGFNDVATTLNDTTYQIPHMCLNVNINKWSLHKPVVYPNKLGELTEAEFQSVDYGLEPVVMTNANPGLALNLVNHVNAKGSVDWNYIRPTGGASSPFRISDFIGYQHNRNPWFNLQLGVEQGSYAQVTQGHSITVEQDADIDIGWLRQNMSTFKNLGANLACSGVFVYREGMTASNDWCMYCAFRSFQNLNGRSNFVVGIPSNFPTGKYIVVPAIAYFPSGMPSKLANLTDSTGSYNYVFFQGTSDAETQTPPKYMLSRVERLYPLPCIPGKIQVFAQNDPNFNVSNYFIVSMPTTAGTYGVTTTKTTYNGKTAWMVKVWGNVVVSMTSSAPSGLSPSVTVTLNLPNCTAQGGFNKDASNRPTKALSVTKTSPATISTTSGSPITFYLVEGEFNANTFGWYETDASGNQTFRCAYLPYTKQAQGGTAISSVFSMLD